MIQCLFRQVHIFPGQYFHCITAEDDETGDDRKKRPRTAFTAAQIKALESEFEKNKYLSVSKRMQLSKQLKLTETQVNRGTFPLNIVSTKLSFPRSKYGFKIVAQSGSGSTPMTSSSWPRIITPPWASSLRGRCSSETDFGEFRSFSFSGSIKSQQKRKIKAYQNQYHFLICIHDIGQNASQIILFERSKRQI